MNREPLQEQPHREKRITEAEGDAFEKNLKSEKRTTVVTRSGSGVQRHHKKHSNSTVRLSRSRSGAEAAKKAFEKCSAIASSIRCVCFAWFYAQQLYKNRIVECVCLMYTLRVLRMVLFAAALRNSVS